MLKECLSYLREGDTLVVYKFDRIGRSLKDLVDIFADLHRRGIMLSAVYIVEKKTFIHVSFSPHHRHLEELTVALERLAA